MLFHSYVSLPEGTITTIMLNKTPLVPKTPKNFMVFGNPVLNQPRRRKWWTSSPLDESALMVNVALMGFCAIFLDFYIHVTFSVLSMEIHSPYFFPGALGCGFLFDLFLGLPLFERWIDIMYPSIYTSYTSNSYIYIYHIYHIYIYTIYIDHIHSIYV